jgi:hypothetical protein
MGCRPCYRFEGDAPRRSCERGSFASRAGFVDANLSKKEEPFWYAFLTDSAILCDRILRLAVVETSAPGKPILPCQPL